jgi:hypothetical protein
MWSTRVKDIDVIGIGASGLVDRHCAGGSQTMAVHKIDARVSEVYLSEHPMNSLKLFQPRTRLFHPKLQKGC